MRSAFGHPPRLVAGQRISLALSVVVAAVEVAKGRAVRIEHLPAAFDLNGPSRRRKAVDVGSGHAGWAGYSITSSARPRSESGKVIPSALAVFRLMISPYRDARSTGRSAAFSPLR